MRKYQACGLAVFAVVAGTIHSAHATVFSVTTTSDTTSVGDGLCSLREAVTAANGNTCRADCGCGSSSGLDHVSLKSGKTYTLNRSLTVSDAMVIYGNQAVVKGSSGGGDFAGIYVKTNEFVMFQNVVLENFRRAALVIDEDAALEAWGLEVRNNPFSVGSGQNASILVMGGAYLYLYGANIHHNTQSIKGGGIFINPDGWVDLEASLIQYNQVSQYGGGVHNLGHFHCYGGSLISNNSAVYGGGGVYNTTNGVFDGPSGACHVINNTSTSGGANIGGHP